MAFVAASSPKVPANRQYPVRRGRVVMGPIRPNTAWFGPTNGPTTRSTRETTSVHAAPGTVVIAATDTGVSGSSKQHERTVVTAGALSGQLAASSPAGLAAANDLTIPIYHRPARGRRAPAGGALPGSPSLARSFTRVASGTSNVVPATAAVVEAAVSTEPTPARSALPIVRGPLVIGAGPSVRPIHGSDETIVSGG
jgi:hypothetical protein